MNQPEKNFFVDVAMDLRGIIAQAKRPLDLRSVLWCIFATDAFAIMSLYRMRRLLRKYKIPVFGRLLRFCQTALYGIEISVDAKLGHGIYFVHPVGVVVGGDSEVGAGCMFLGSNTLGTIDGPYPKIGNRVILGAGARVLNGITIGDDSKIGANAVVINNAPAGSTLVGIPAKII